MADSIFSQVTRYLQFTKLPLVDNAISHSTDIQNFKLLHFSNEHITLNNVILKYNLTS